MGKSAASREEVAARAGVSAVTVSRCYTNPDSVAPKRRATILAIAEELGYHPNRGASLMRANATGRIALIERIPKPGWEWEGNRLFDYLFKSTYHGVFRGLAESVYAMSYLQVSDEIQLEETIRKTPMDGIIGMNFEYPEEMAPILDSGIPYVIAHNVRNLEGFNRCYTDNYQGGYLAGSLLRETAHRNVAYVTTDTGGIPTHADRLQGFRDGLGAASLRIVLDLEERGESGGLKAAAAIADLLRGGQPLDAIGVVNDETAIYLSQALLGEGFRIPEDISIIGYDRLPLTHFLPFELATLDLNLEAVYHVAVASLIKLIRGGGAVSQGISPFLVKGDSVRDRTGP